MLITLYDNLLIYYPNIFFPVFFILLVVASLALYHITILADKKIKKASRTKTRSPLRKIIKNIYLIIMLIFIYLEVKTEKIIKRIEKEILIDKNS